MKYISILILVVSLIGCTAGSNRNSTICKGLWYNESEERIWFVKDSLIVFYTFYPYSRWEMNNDTIKILDLGSLHLDTPLWFEYSFEMLTDSEVNVKFLEENEGSFKLQRITQVDDVDYQLEKISLQVSDCAYDIDCVDLKVEVNFPDAKMKIWEIKESGSTFICNVDTQELLALKYLVSKVPWSEINKPFISNEMHSNYFSLIVEFEDLNQNKKVLSDTGGSAPPSIDNLITFIWATSQLRCMQEEYQRDLFSY
jgi:hypothetical protein